jgi:nucleoid-associated protein YgaU
MKTYTWALISYFIYFIPVHLLAQDLPLNSAVNEPRLAPLDKKNKDSSSFIADPDPLDPLPLRIESIKEDAEPVLEDIRNAAPSSDKNTTDSAQAVGVDDGSSNAGNANIEKENPGNNKNNTDGARTENATVEQNTTEQPKTELIPPTQKISQKKKFKRKKSKKKTLKPDDPDLRYEARLNRIYRIYNITPTSAELWSQVTGDRKVETFVVENGNTLESISRMLFGDSQFWPKIWALNWGSITNPHQIYPGQKIYFYPATVTEIPTVAMQINSEVNTAEKNGFSGEKSIDGRDYAPQMTEFGGSDLRKHQNKKSNGPQPLPDSLPLVRQTSYFSASKPAATVIDIQEILPAPVSVPKNPYIISSETLSTDFLIPAEEVDNIICMKGQYIKKTIRTNPQALPGRYLLVEDMDMKSSGLKKTFIYKIVGDVQLGEKNELRVKTCEQLINTETLIVSEAKVRSLAEPTERLAHGPQLIQSLESEKQEYFNLGQRVVINSDTGSVAEGMGLNIYSEEAGGVVGKVQILKKTGTMAVGYLTGISRLIKIGDSILSDEGMDGSADTSGLEQGLDSELSLTE